jgi:hypothetical protein
MIDNNLHKDKRKIMLVILGTLIVLLGITYAYYIAQIGPGSKTNINLTSDTLDKLTFTQGDDLSLNATQFNFTNGGSNLTSSTTASATLIANSTNNTASDTYNVYVKILDNTYDYTTETSVPEIILSITDPTGAAVTSITGLTYVTADGVSGFDVTNKGGSFVVNEGYAIAASNSTTGITQNWTATLTYINLTSDQSANAGKNMTAKLYVQKESAITTLVNHTAQNVADLPTNISTLNYKNGIRYSGNYDDVNNWICFGSTNATCPENNKYRIIGAFNLDGVYKYKLIQGDYATTTELGTPYDTIAVDTSATYHTKQTTINTYQFDAADATYPYGHNEWSTSDIKTLLNTTYLTNLGTTWSNKIATSTYYVGGTTLANGYAKDYYQVESTGTTWSGKVGLMYISDMNYASISQYWLNNNVAILLKDNYKEIILKDNIINVPKNKTKKLTPQTNFGEEGYQYDWLFNGGINEWTISPYSSSANNGWSWNYIGYLNYIRAYDGYGVRPVFYLNSDVAITGGTGAYATPYTISVS